MSAGTDALKTAFRDYRTQGVPATGANDPDKGEIRGALDVLGGELSALVGEVDAVEARVNTLQNSQSAGAIGAETFEDLEAITDQPEGTIGRVFDDPTPANNGEYIWDGSDWNQVAVDRITKAEDAASTVVNLRYPIVYDKDDVLGGGAESFYVSRELYAKRGAAVLNGAYGIASTQISTHVKLTVQNNLSTVYLDLTDDTNPVKVANYPTLAPVGTSYIILATVRSGVVNSDHAVEYIESTTGSKITPRARLVVDGDSVLIPPFYYFRRRNETFSFYQPSDGAYFFELTASTVNNQESRYYFDRMSAEAGGAPFKTVTGSANAPVVVPNNEYTTLVATTLNRNLITGLPTHDQFVDSQFLRGNDPDRSLLFSSLTELADVTDPDLNALGITRGVTGDEAFYGTDLPPDVPLKGFYFYRVYVQASADDTWPEVRAYSRSGRDSTIGGFATLVMEKRISARAAIFLLFGRYNVAERPARINIGAFQSTNPAIICGAQVYVGGAEYPWIRRGQWPAVGPNDLVYGPEMFMVDGRKLPIYPDNLMGIRQPSPILSVASPKTLPNIDFDVQAQGGQIVLDPDDLGSTVNLTAISGGAERTAIKRRSVAVSSAATPLAGSPKILLLGDSITNRQTGWGVETLLEDWGLTPTWVGTINGADTTAVLSTGGPLGEGREGWATTDFIGTEIGDATNGVLAVGNEATYAVATKDNKTKYQPFLNPNTAAGSAAPIVNIGGTDYRFDMQFYLDRFSLDDPDIVAVNLGMNNLLEGYDTMLSTVSTDLPIIIAEIRRALPSTKILLWSTTVPYGQMGDGRQRDGWSAIHKFLVDHVEELNGDGDTDVHLCSAWAHQSPFAGWDITDGVIADPTHPNGTARWQHAEALAAAIANLA